MSSFKSRFCQKDQWFASSHPPQSSAVQWGGDIPTVSFQKQGLLYSIWPSSHHPWRIWRIHLLQVWKLLECFILGIWVCGSLPTNPIVGRLTSVESFPARRVHSPQVRFKIIFVLQFPLLLLSFICLYIFQVPLLVRLYFPGPYSCTLLFSRSLFLYVETEALVGGSLPAGLSNNIKRSDDILTFVKVFIFRNNKNDAMEKSQTNANNVLIFLILNFTLVRRLYLPARRSFWELWRCQSEPP